MAWLRTFLTVLVPCHSHTWQACYPQPFSLGLSLSRACVLLVALLSFS